MVRIRIRIRFFVNLGHSDHCAIVIAVVDQNELALFAGTQDIASLKVSDMVPIGALFFFEPIDRIDFGFGFEEPILSHAVRLAKPKLCRKVKF